MPPITHPITARAAITMSTRFMPHLPFGEGRLSPEKRFAEAPLRGICPPARNGRTCRALPSMGLCGVANPKEPSLSGQSFRLLRSVPRERTARLPVLDAPARRTEGLSPRTSRALRARLVAAVVPLVSLALITVYFRESDDGALHGAQRIGLSVAMPFEVAGERIARPFRDAWGWASDLIGAKEENEKLREEVEAVRKQLIENETAASENEDLRALLEFVDGPRFPEGYTGVATRVVGRPPSAYSQEVLIAAGPSSGIQRDDPVVTQGR